jgi:hypothetical protein
MTGTAILGFVEQLVVWKQIEVESYVFFSDGARVSATGNVVGHIEPNNLRGDNVPKANGMLVVSRYSFVTYKWMP